MTPEGRGIHQLNVKVNGAHIKNSPFTVTVYMPPDRLSKPLTTISGLKHPCSLRCSRDKILASEIRKSRIIQIDSKFQVQELHMLMEASPSELTQDSDLNIYATTGKNHKVMKLSNTGSIIKVIGVLGKRHAEFNFPNGLRVNTKHELYVCDSRNDRVQIFDLNLNFKRSFGKTGTGKGQFNFPADVNFDLSDNIFVTDMKNNRIQIFSCTERHIRTINVDQIFKPVNLFIHDKTIYVTDCGHHIVWVMDTAGDSSVIANFGNGYLLEPEGITMDEAGLVYVTSDESKIVVF